MQLCGIPWNFAIVMRLLTFAYTTIIKCSDIYCLGLNSGVGLCHPTCVLQLAHVLPGLSSLPGLQCWLLSSGLTFTSWLFNVLKSVRCLKFSYVCRNSITPEDYTKIIKVVNSRICSEINEAQQRPYLTGEIKVRACWQTLTVERNVASSR